MSRPLFSFGERDRGRRRSGKVGISRLLRDFQGVVGTGGNLFLVFAGFHGSAFSTAHLFVCFGEWLAVAIESPHYMRAIAQRHPSVEVFMNRDGTARQRAAKTRLLDLPHSFTNGDGVVFGDHPFRLHREHPIQIRPAGTPEGTPFLFGPHRELCG